MLGIQMVGFKHSARGSTNLLLSVDLAKEVKYVGRSSCVEELALPSLFATMLLLL